MGLPIVGVRAEVQNVAGYQSAIKTINNANDSAGQSVNHLSNIFDFAIGGVITNAIGGIVNIASQAAGAVIDFAGKSIDAAREGAAAQRQLNAVLTSTHGVAGVTAADVNKLADRFSNLTKFSDNEVVSASDLLLTFTKIGKKTFPDALKAVLDMSTAMGQDAKTSAIQLGKALQDPLKGVTALQRVGVVFSATQKQQIANFVKMGDVASAQKVILSELTTEFGGSAAAAATPWDLLQNRIEKFQEAVGGALIPIFDGVAAAINPLIDKYMPSLVDLLSNQVGPAIVTATTVFGDFITNISDGLDPMDALNKALFESGIPPETVQSIDDFANKLIAAAQSIGTFLTGLGNFVVGVVNTVSAASTAWSQLTLIVFDVLNTASTAATQLVTIVAGALSSAWTAIVTAVGNVLTSASTAAGQLPLILVNALNEAAKGASAIVSGFYGIGVGIVDNIKAGISSVHDTPQAIGVQDWISNVGSQIAGFIGTGAAVIGNIILGIQSTVGQIGSSIGQGITDAISVVGTLIADFVPGGAAIISNIVSGITSTIGNVGAELAKGPAGWIDAVKAALTGFVDIGSQIIAGIVAGIQTNAGAILSALGGVVSGAINSAKKMLGIQSPSKVFAGIGANIMAGMQGGIMQNAHLPAMAIQTASATAVMSGVQASAAPVYVGGGNTSSSSIVNNNGGNTYNLGLQPYQPQGSSSSALLAQMRG
jgi:hypothetical protein